jgi:hypothetical protein
VAAASPPRGLIARLDERLNPIVLQEVRRGLRTRVFSIASTLLLVACAVIALVSFGVYEPGGSTVGQGTFVAVFACLSIVASSSALQRHRPCRQREDRTCRFWLTG